MAERTPSATEQRGMILNGACLAMVTLPGYEIVLIRTGQYLPREGHI